MKSTPFLITRRCSTSSHRTSPRITRFSSSSSAQLSSQPGPRFYPDITHFHAALQSCIEGRNPRWALILFRQSLQSQLKPNDFTFSLLIKACASSTSSSLFSIDAKREAFQIQTHLTKLGFDRFSYVGTAFLCLYAGLGAVSIAHKLFDGMPNKDVVTWNALICGYVRVGDGFNAFHLFDQMLRDGISPSETTLVSLVPSCGHQELAPQGKSVHGFGIKAGLALDSRVKNALTSMYAKSCDLTAAETMYNEMTEKSVVSWNAMITAYGQNGFFDEALIVFKQMLKDAVATNSVTILALLSANAHAGSTHCYAIKAGFTSDASVITSLVCVYARFGNTKSAELLNSSLPDKNMISLTAIISSYADQGNVPMVVDCFSEMLNYGIKPDSIAIISMLQVFTNTKYIRSGQAFHGFGVKSGLCSDSLLVNGLMSMYARSGEMGDVFSLFAGLHEKTFISWNTVISGCVQAGRPGDAIAYFCQMKILGYSPDAVTLASLLCGCAQLGHLHFGKRLHNHALRNNHESEEFVGTALIDMYAKCGSLESAEMVFNSTKAPCLATWNTMISSYSLYGLERKALGCFSEMQEKGLKPDEITFLGVLSACSHSGLVEEGRKYFRAMTEEFAMLPGLQHYTCMINLFGRAGLLEEAFLFVKSMAVRPDLTVWGALLGACCVHQELKLGESVAKKLLFLDYNNWGFYILMSNLYAANERWADVARVREMMKDTGGDGCSGISLVEVASLDITYIDIDSRNFTFEKD